MNTQDVTPYKMNLPTDLKTEVEQKAEKNHRSLSGEIIHRLHESLETDIPQARNTVVMLEFILENHSNTTIDLIASLKKSLGMSE